MYVYVQNLTQNSTNYDFILWKGLLMPGRPSCQVTRLSFQVGWSVSDLWQLSPWVLRQNCRTSSERGPQRRMHGTPTNAINFQFLPAKDNAKEHFTLKIHIHRVSYVTEQLPCCNLLKVSPRHRVCKKGQEENKTHTSFSNVVIYAWLQHCSDQV